MEMAEFYNLSEVARMLKVSPLTVRRWVQEGKLKAFHPKGTRLYRIPEDALREFVGEEWFAQIAAEVQQAEGETPKRRGRRRRA
jgi:excisionase family DNA binding protein